MPILVFQMVFSSKLKYKKMRRLLQAILLAATSFVTANASAQVPTQEQLQTADAQLNQVYQQLRGTLSTDQKQQLKLAQRDWIKQRDAFVAANPGNPQGALYQATMQRAQQLGLILGKTPQNGMPSSAESISKMPLDIRIDEKAVYPTPQVNDQKWIISTTSSDNESLIAVAHPELVKIWTKNYESLVRSINCRADALRIIPGTHILLTIGKPLDAENTTTGTEINAMCPVATYWNIEDGSKLASFTLVCPKGVDVPYITGDCHHVIFCNNERTDLDRVTFYETKLPLVDLEDRSLKSSGDIRFADPQKKWGDISINVVGNHDKIKSRFPEIDGSLDKSGRISSDLINESAKNLRNSGEILIENLSINQDGTKFCIMGKGLVRIVEFEIGVAKEIKIPDQWIAISGAFSSDGSHLAVLASPADAGQQQEGNIVFKGFVIDLNNQTVLFESTIPAGIVPAVCSGKPEIQWIRDKIYISDGAIFDSKFSLQQQIKGLFLPTSPLKSEVLVKAVEAGKTSPRGKPTVLSLALYDLNNLESASDLKLKDSENGDGALPFYGDPTCPNLSPFDISPNCDAIIKSWKYWRGGGGLCFANSAINQSFENLLSGRMPTFASFLPNGNILCVELTEKGSETQIVIIDPTQPQKALSVLKTPIIYSLKISPDRKSFYGIQKSGFVVRYEIRDNAVLPCAEYLSNSRDSLVITPEFIYLSHGNPNNLLRFTKKAESYPLEQFDLRLNRPDIVLERLGAPKEAIETAKSLRDKRLKRMGVTEEMLKPDFHLPELQIMGDVPATTSKDQLDLQIKATDDKYPLDRLRVYVNNVPVKGRDGELLRDQKTQSLEKTIPIKLAAGRNKIQVSVLNSAGAESLYANAEVNCTAERPKPKLYAVALGVSQYDRPEWCLKYAAKDATDLIGKLKAKAGSSYSEVKPLLLTDKEVTKESAAKIKDFLSRATIDDTVLIFMAGHGLLDDKYDYYFGTTDIDPAKPSERGMPYEAIDTILAEVPSLKKALLMDTCHAGELDQDEKKELAASDGAATPSAIPASDTNSSPMAGKVAMRSIGTRGMTVKAVEGAKGKSDWYEKLQDMFVDLRRGSGATVISSSQGAEYAFESSEQSNGLFTYSLMEALDGKATPNKDGQITISSVGDYVKKRVQDLTKGKQNPNLRGVNLEEDFSLSSAK